MLAVGSWGRDVGLRSPNWNIWQLLRSAEEEKPVNREEMERSGEGSAPNGSGSGNGNRTGTNSKDGNGSSRQALGHRSQSC